MTPKQQRFVQEYLIDLNATQAAIRAGYSKKTAKQIGQENLTKPDVKTAIDKALDDRAKETKVDQKYVIDNLIELVERCMQRAPVTDMRGNQIQDEEGRDVWRFDSKGANTALTTLAKHLGMLTDKVQMDHSGSVSLQAEVRKALLGHD